MHGQNGRSRVGTSKLGMSLGSGNSRYYQRKLAARQSSRDVSRKRRTGAHGEDTGRTGNIDKICDEALPIGIRKLDTVSFKN